MRGQPMLYSDFGGGLNTKGAPYVLEDNEARDVLNVQSTTARAIVKRDGIVTFATPASVLDSLYAAEAPASPVLITHAGTSLFGITAAGAISTLKTGLSSSNRWEWAQTQVSGGQGPIFGLNGVDTPQQWDGAARTTSDWTASSGTLPNGRYIVLHQNYLFVAGVAGNPSRLCWCNIAAGTGTDARNWPAANVIDLDPNDGDAITGLGKAGNLLLVFKRHKVFAVFNPATGENRRISDSIGCVSHRSIAESPQGTFFLSERGVWRTNGSTLELVSDPVTPNLAAASLAVPPAAAFWNNHYFLSYSTDGTRNTLTLDYDLTLGSWWLHGIGSNQWQVWHPSANNPGLYSAKATAALVDQCFVPGISTDNGSNFTWYWKGPWLSPAFYRRRRFPTPYYRKRLRDVRVDGQGVVDFSVAKDFTASEQLVVSGIFASDPADTFGGSGTFGDPASTFGGGPTVPLARIGSLGVARAFSPVFGATSSSAAAVYSMTLLIQDRKD